MNQDIIKGQWKQLIGKAKTTWGKLADDELLQIQGNAQRLTGLVQERYGATREEAEAQVKKFFDGIAASKPDKGQGKSSVATYSPPVI